MANIERTLETLVDFADVHRQGLSRLTESIDALTHQVEILSENMTRLEITAERIWQAIESDRKVAEIQAENVRSLTQLATALLQKIAA